MNSSAEEKTIVLLENLDGYNEFLKIVNNIDIDQLTIISTSPHVCYKLDKSGYSYKIIEEYYDSGTLIEFGMNNIEVLNKFCTEIDDFFRSGFSLIDNYGFKPGHDAFFFMKILYDSLAIRIEILQRIISEENPEKIITFAHNNLHKRSHIPDIPYKFKESIYNFLLDLPELNTGIIHENYDIETPDQPTNNYSLNKFINRVKRCIQSNNQISNFLFIAKEKGFPGSLKPVGYILKNTISQAHKLLFIGFAYNWEYIIPELYINGYTVEHYENRINISSSNQNIPANKELKEIINKYCIYKGIDFSEPFLRPLFPLFESYVSFCSANAEKIDENLKKLRPKALIFGTKSSFYEHIIAHIARHNNIPVISWQHGSSELNDTPILFYNEVADSDIHLCFGNTVSKGYHEKEGLIQDKTKIFSVGSMELQSLYLKKKEENPEYKALYVTTNYMENHLYIGYPGVLQDNILWDSQKRILNTLSKTKENIAFKLHPSRSYSDENLYEYISDEKFGNITIYKDEIKFTNLLEQSDIVIIDFPSTTLLQALSMHKVVFVLLKHFPVSDYARKLLQKCAYCSDDIEEFTDTINRYVNNLHIAQNPDVYNTEFLEQYGIHKTDREVAKRAINILKSEIAARFSIDQP